MITKAGIVVLATMMAVGCYAESITHGDTTINMGFVDIGYAGNTADKTGYGAVDYNYRMGQKEVTIDQFSMARAADIRIGNGNEDYWNEEIYTLGANAPASFVSAYEAMKFANYLTTGNAVKGAYQFSGDGLTLLAIDRDAAITAYSTVYVLPTENEWYKTAYFKPDGNGYSLYADGTDWVHTLPQGTSGWNYYNPFGSFSSEAWETGFGAQEQNGTFDIMGNVYEWSESAFDGTLENMAEDRVLRGGGFYNDESYLRSSGRSYSSPEFEGYGDVGFRVAAIPEPSTAVLIATFGGFGLFFRRVFAINQPAN